MPFFKSRRFCKSSTAKYKALLLGINYASPTDDHEQGYRPLQGPVNDAKDVKKALIGGAYLAALLLTRSTPLLSELFHYKEDDICLMTDEEANRNTALWPSEANIVSLSFRMRPYVVPLSLPTLTDIRLAQRKALRDFVRDASPGDAFVFFCTLPNLFTYFFLIITSLDAGHSGQQPVTTDPNEDDGLDECPSNLIILPAPPNSDAMPGYRHCDLRLQDHPRQCEPRVGRLSALRC